MSVEGTVRDRDVSSPVQAPSAVYPPGGQGRGEGESTRREHAHVARPRRGGAKVGTAVRLAAFHAVVLAGVLALVVAGLYLAFERQVHAATTRSLVAEARDYAQAAARRPVGRDLHSFSKDYLATHVLPEGVAVVIAFPGRDLLGSAGSEALLSAPLMHGWARRPPGGTEVRGLVLAGRDATVVATPLNTGEGSGQRTVATIAAAADDGLVHSGQSGVLALAIGEAALAFVAGVACVYLLLRRLLRTVGRITATAAGLAGGDLDRRLGDLGTDDEVGRLAATFDAMADRVQSAMTSQRRLLSDVSHQLRTPLTVARGHLEVLDRTGAGDPHEVRETVTLVIDELDHMRSLVERLLLLGRALEPDFLEPVALDLRSFLADLRDAARVLAPRQWRFAPIPDLVILADPAKLRGAMLNLIDNAVRVTRPRDGIEVVAARGRDGSLVLAVDDAGPGIPAERRGGVLARFSRPGAVDSEGSGLGLAIVKAVAEAHGGRLELTDSPLGGCRAAIILPRAVVEFAGPPASES